MKTTRIVRSVLSVILLGVLLLASCEKESAILDEGSDFYYPPLTGAAWEMKDPTSLGWDIDKLNDLIEYVRENKSGAFIILHRGKIVSENYWSGFSSSSSNRIFSASKSIAGFLVGLAEQQGKINLSEPVSTYLGPGWSRAPVAKERLITVQHLLTMTSGLNESLTYNTVPGTKWYYNTLAYHKIYNVLAVVFKKSNEEYTQELLWSKIGMQHSFWDSEPGGGPSMSCSARDMARFGLMILSDGKWAGQPIMNNEGYFDAMLNSSQTINPAYGYLWWLNGKSSFILPGTSGVSFAGSLFPDAPNDLLAALGFGDKKIYVLKSEDLVVVRHGAPSDAPVSLASSSFDNEIWKRLMLVIK
jgi:CubicO group peptidase (beta-lactamase class C family)